MVSVNCPSCGSSVSFRTEFSTHAVCAACDSLLVRQGAQVDLIGKVAELQPDGSPLRVGAQGEYGGTTFQLIGRIQLSYGDGFWNEWYLLYSDGRTGWLGEAMGEYFINSLAKLSGGLPSPENLAPGDGLSLDGEAFVATGSVISTLVTFEGELPFIVESRDPFLTVDLRSASGRAATIDYSESPPLLFLGEYKRFQTFHFKSLRDVNENDGGYSAATAQRAPSGGVENFNCPTCGAAHTVSGGVASKVLVCEYCGSAVDISNPKLEVIWREESMRDAVAKGVSLKLGYRATLDGFEYTLIGFVKKSVKYEGVTYPWVEYLLHNRLDGYRWLVESDGHYSLMQTMESLPTRGGQVVTRPDQQAVEFEGVTYRHFQTSSPEVNAVAGEFYWRIKMGEDTTNFDYVAPPRLLSMEASATGFVWSSGRYLTDQEVRQLFALDKSLPPAVGIAPSQPNPYQGSNQSMWRTFWLAALAGLVLLASGLLAGSGKTVFSTGSLGYDTYRTFVPQESQPFKISGGGNLAFDFQASLNNRWLFLETQLIDMASGKATKVGATIENYQGQGDPRKTVRVSGIPAGEYKLLWTIQSGSESKLPEVADEKKKSERVRYSITLRRGVAVWGWYVLMMMILLPFPLFELARRSSFETKRWYNSDHG